MRTKLLLVAILFSLQINAQQCWSKLASGLYHSIAIANDGTLWSWGANNYGTLGDGTTVNKINPIQIGTDTDWIYVGAGYHHSFAIKSNGTLWAWGYNFYGQLGRGTNGSGTNSSTPIQIGAETNWKSITGGEHFTIATKTDGTLWSTGKNSNGQLGLNNLIDSNTFQQIGSSNSWDKIACGRYHSLALSNNGTLYVWGANGGGQLGLTHTTDRKIPTPIFSGTIYFTEIAGNQGATIAISTDRKMYSAGYGLIPGSSYTMSEYVTSPANWMGVKIGGNFIVATKTDGSMWMIGNNDYGQFGNPSFVSSNTFVQPNLNSGWALNSESIQVNIYGVLAFNASGQLYVTGQNHVGQFGNGTTANSNVFNTVSCPPSIVLSSGEFDSKNTFSIYPNPVKNTLNISLQDNSEIQRVVIYDVTGKQVKYQDGNTNSIDVEDIKSGFYLLEITINDKKEVRKFIKQ
ncbi:MAG: T9SS type A sorting domain-containing protein [Flavobacterium sp.]